MTVLEKAMWCVVLLSAGTTIGVFVMALLSINKNSDDEENTEQ